MQSFVILPFEMLRIYYSNFTMKIDAERRISIVGTNFTQVWDEVVDDSVVFAVDVWVVLIEL